jgi:hypothetical protein
MENESILPAVRLKELAAELARLAPSHRNPEEYHLRKSSLIADLRDLARGLDGHRPIVRSQLPERPIFVA